MESARPIGWSDDVFREATRDAANDVGRANVPARLRREPSTGVTEVVADDRPVVVRDRAGSLLFEHFPDSGKTVVHVPAGDLELRATGRIDLVAGDAVSIAAARTVSIATETIDVRATAWVESVRTAFREATELAETRAGRIRAIAESTFHLVAERALVRAAESLKLRGKKIHLA